LSANAAGRAYAAYGGICIVASLRARPLSIAIFIGAASQYRFLVKGYQVTGNGLSTK
jgi:drug/metabolite transporter superfamily protein YnfA